MRAGGCTVQQALTPEAAVVVKQAVSLARRRGNAQVTPLHVASAMLQHQHQHQQGAAAAPKLGLLRAACLRSHSHPLQCKALELCFNVALNRLPASTSPLLAGHGHVYYPPSLSNALVAAFKRAQAHQRRGSAAADTTQQQPVVAVKIELEQLVISILDDPSVSRVMREAGFSSTQVKANVEHAVSTEATNNSACTTAAAPQNPNPSAAPSEETKPSKLVLPLDQVRDEDVSAILDGLATRRKRRVMVVAECAAGAEAAVRAAVDKIRRGEALPLRSAQVISVSVSRFRDLPRDEAERRLAELRRAVRAGGGRAGGGAVLVVEDLGWAAEFWAGRAEEVARRGMRWPSSSCCGGYYCAVERAVAEVRSLACLDGDGVWLVGHGTYQSYMRCRAGRPSLEILWELQTLAVPAGSLALSLNCVDNSAMAVSSHQSTRAKCEASGNGSVSRCMSLWDAGGSGQLTAISGCCGDCCANAAKALARSIVPSSSSIPPWLQRCSDHQELSHCQNPPMTLNFSTVVSPSSSVSSYEQHNHHLHQPWLVTDAHEATHPWQATRCGGGQVHVLDDDDVKIVSAVKVASHDSSASNGAAAEVERRRSRFKELSAENLKLLCSALEKEVPWQAELVPEIASTVLRCRSGVARRRDAGADDAARQSSGAKEDTWLLFLGGDADGKARVARELASLVFRSRRNFVSIGGATAALSPARSDSTEQQHRSKRPRSAETASNGSCLERLYEAVRDNPHRVIFLEDVDQAGRRCQTGVLEAMESGVVRSPGGDGEVALGDAIVVLSCECLDSRSRNFSPPPPTTTKKAKREGEEASKEEEGAGDHHNEDIIAAAVSSSLSSSCFDLNVSVENDEVEESCFTVAGLLKAVDRAFFFTQPGQSSDWVASDQPLV